MDLTNAIDLEVFCQLREIIELFSSEEVLKESQHPFNSQTNEALNKSQSMVTPKVICFSKSKVLIYHNALIVSIHNWGYVRFYKYLFQSLGLDMLPTTKAWTKKKT